AAARWGGPAAARTPRSVRTRAPGPARDRTGSGARSLVSPVTITSRTPGRLAACAAAALNSVLTARNQALPSRRHSRQVGGCGHIADRNRYRTDVQAAQEQGQQLRSIGHAQQQPLLGPNPGCDGGGRSLPSEVVELAVGVIGGRFVQADGRHRRSLRCRGSLAAQQPVRRVEELAERSHRCPIPAWCPLASADAQPTGFPFVSSHLTVLSLSSSVAQEFSSTEPSLRSPRPNA